MGSLDAGGLAKAKRVISSVMRTKGAKMLFNDPVDPEALGLPDYLEVIAHPIDLGTIINRLEESLAAHAVHPAGVGMSSSVGNAEGGVRGSSGRGSGGRGRGGSERHGGYNNPYEVLEDVQQVWKNCYMYNWRDCDAPTRGVCDEVKGSFEKAWKAAGLKPGKEGKEESIGGGVTGRGGRRHTVASVEDYGERMVQVDEADVPERFSVRADEADLPLRLLDNFSVSIGGQYTSLDNLGSPGFHGLTARGCLVAQPSQGDRSANGGSGSLHIQLDHLQDWSIQYGAFPGLWVITRRAWYRLLNPSKEYEAFLSPTLGKFDFCIKASELQENGAGKKMIQSEIVDKLMDSVFATIPGSPAAVDLNENDGMAFVRKQLLSWLKVGKQQPSSDVHRDGSKVIGMQLNDRRDSPDLSKVRTGSRSSSRKRPRPITKDESEKSGLTPMPSVKSSPVKVNTVGSHADDAILMEDEVTEAPIPPKSPSRLTRASSKHKSSGANVRPMPPKDSRSGVPMDKDYRSQRVPIPLEEGPAGDYTSATKARSHRIRVKIPPNTRLLSGPMSTNRSPVASPTASIPVEPTSATGAQASESDASGITQPSDQVPGPSTQNSPHATRRKFSVSALMDLSDSSDSDDALISKKKKKLSEFERKRLRRAKEERARLRKDIRQDEVRGDPPDPQSNFRVEGPLIGEILSVWEFVMAFSGLLQVAPFPLWRLEASISPLSKPQTGGSNLQGGAPIVNRGGLASGALLRDIHNGLLRIVEGKASNTEPPAMAKVVEDERNGSSTWFQRVSLFLLRAPVGEVDDETRNLGQFLQTHDYVELKPQSRLRILRTLIDLSLGTELLRESINGYAEGGLALKKRVDGQEETKSVDPMETVDVRATENTTAVTTNEEPWMEWVQSCKLGYMKLLGEDIRGRKYWVFGAHAGAWKVYVETPPEYSGHDEPTNEHPHQGPQSKWGWYEKEKLQNLIAWLKEGGLQYEKPLLLLLEKIPEPLHAHHRLEIRSTGGEMQAAPQQGSGYPGDSASMKVDGYSSIVAPHLRGEGDCPEMAYTSPIELRVVVCIQSLLGLAPFWLDESGQLGNKLCVVIEGLQAARTVYDLVRQLLNAEEVLHEHNCLKSEWGHSWQKEWRLSALSCQNIEDTALHLVTLQEFLKSDPYRLHRTAFNACAAEARCPLYFPLPVESVVFLRTGCLSHVKKYLSFADSTSFPPNITGDPGPTEAEKEKANVVPVDEERPPKDLLIAKGRISSLGPVERFKIACISYRSPFPCDYPKGDSYSQKLSTSAPQLQCLWLLMQSIPTRPGMPVKSVAVPIHIDNTLADFVVKISTYDQGTRKRWKTGERFRMFFGGKSSRGGQGGVYYKGSVVLVEDVKPGELYDPWESIMVEWDNDSSESPLMKVSPWEIEIDPEEEQRLEVERRREEEARSRAARAAAKQQRTEYIASLGAYEGLAASPNDPDFDPDMDIPGVARNRRRGTSLNEMVYYDPSSPVGPIPSGVIQALPEREGFTILIYNFMRRLKGKFKCPIFAGHELDLHRVFHEVQNRGGYDRVTQLKLWKEVCRTLNVNLTGQTSASYNMRLNYEKCLLDFEHYLAKGEYTREVAEGTGPSSTRLDSGPVPPKPRSPVVPSPPSTVHLQAGPPDPCTSQQLLNSSINLTMAHQHPANIQYSQMPSTGVSMTELLLADEFGQEFGAQVSGGPWTSTVPVGTSAMSPSWLKMLAPSSNSNSNQASRATTAEPPASQAWAENPEVCNLDQAAPPVEPCGNHQIYAAALGSSKPSLVEIQPGESIGMALNRMGRALVGADLWRRWSDGGEGCWFKAVVTDFHHSTNEHCLTYSQSPKNVKNEWVDLRELESKELSQFAPESHGVLPPVQPQAGVGVVHKTSAHTHLQPQVSVQLLGTPPPIQQFGFPKMANPAQGHRGLVQRGEMHSGASARQLISQVIQMGVNPEHVKILDTTQSSILSQAQQSSSSAYVPETSAKPMDGLADGRKHNGAALASRRMDMGKYSSFPSLSNFSGPIELSGGCGVLPGFEDNLNNPSGLLNQSRTKPPESDLRPSLEADNRAHLPAQISQFTDKTTVQVAGNEPRDIYQVSNWPVEQKVDVLSTSIPQGTGVNRHGSVCNPERFPEGSYVEKLPEVQLPVSEANVGDTSITGLGTDVGCEIRRKTDSFKIKFSIPQKKQ